MSKYASQTEVSPGRSKESIERILMRYGASAFMYGQEDGKAAVQFKFKTMMVRFVIPMPDPNSDEFVYSEKPGGKEQKVPDGRPMSKQSDRNGVSLTWLSRPSLKPLSPV